MAVAAESRTYIAGISYQKDPAATLDFAFDWTEWLASGETITSYTVTVDDGLTIASHSRSAGIVTAWISGGSAGTTYRLVCKVTTDLGVSPAKSRIDERTIEIVCANR